MVDAIKSFVRDRAKGRCEYCRMPQSGNFLDFEFDHIIAQKHQGPGTPENLAYACFHCNSQKGPNIAGYDFVKSRIVRLFHPRKDRWSKHFVWEGPILSSRTIIGQVTISVLDINEPESVDLREMMIEEGLFP